VTKRDGEPAAGTVEVLRSLVHRHQRAFPTVSDMVYQIIRDGILQGAFEPGERLRQDELAEAIGVSRIPVRSALMQLDAEGLITFHSYRGAIVTSVTVDDMREIYEIRALVEPHALRKAMRAMTPERLGHLERLARELNAVEDGAEFLALRIGFFTELYEGGQQPLMLALIERLRMRAGRYWLERDVEYVRGPGERDHTQILGYLREADADGAADWLREHLEQLGRQLVALMQKEQSNS
jgi:DNA-binding GntR family transcriptional regulator